MMLTSVIAFLAHNGTEMKTELLGHYSFLYRACGKMSTLESTFCTYKNGIGRTCLKCPLFTPVHAGAEIALTGGWGQGCYSVLNPRLE